MNNPDIGLIRLARINADELERNANLVRKTRNRLNGDPQVVVWFLPPVEHALKGGVRTAFMFAQHLSEEFNTLNHFVIVSYGNEPASTSALGLSLAEHFPGLRFSVQPFRLLMDDPDTIPYSDCSVCTLWTTAYLQARYSNTRAKFYLVQDFEPAFYESGAVSAVIEATYRFGFSVLSNTRGVAAHMGRYTKDVTQFTPGIDHEMFYPDRTRSAPGKPFRIVFYGRPGNARNCFALGLETLKAVKRKMGSAVEIVSVGAEWDEEEMGVSGVIENRGLLKSMEEVADLYRKSDLGLVYMTTPHPSYQPFEYMASGCVVATNQNEYNTWLLKASNSLLIPPLPEVAAEQIVSLAGNSSRWNALRNNGLSTMQKMSWSSAFSKFRARVTQGVTPDAQ